MNGYVAGLALLVMLAAIMSIATASIGIQCYNKCDSPNMNQTMPKNKTYLIINLVLGILLLLASFGGLYAATKIPSMNKLTGGVGVGGIKDLLSSAMSGGGGKAF
jgi:hypothetical protein